jgi:hypothetical protein
MFYSTLYPQGNQHFGEEVFAGTREGAEVKLAERGLGERLEPNQPYPVSQTGSVVDQFDRGEYVEVAHGVCQLLRLQNDPAKALAALCDTGLLHELVHLSVMPNEPVVTCRIPELRIELIELEERVRPGLNTLKHTGFP